MFWESALSRSSSAMTSMTLPISLSPDTGGGVNPPVIALINCQGRSPLAAETVFSRHGHDDLPEILSRLHDAMGLADVSERNLRIHDGLDLLRQQGPHPAFHKPGDDCRLLHDRLRAQCKTEHL